MQYQNILNQHASETRATIDDINRQFENDANFRIQVQTAQMNNVPVSNIPKPNIQGTGAFDLPNPAQQPPRPADPYSQAVEITGTRPQPGQAQPVRTFDESGTQGGTPLNRIPDLSTVNQPPRAGYVSQRRIGPMPSARLVSSNTDPLPLDEIGGPSSVE